MSAIGSGTGGVVNPSIGAASTGAAGGAGTATSGGTATTPVTLKHGPLATHAAKLSGVAAGTETIKLGDRGDHIRAIEAALDLALGIRGRPNGVMDRTTQGRVAQFQRANGLTPSGEVDQATLAKLDEAAAAKAAAGATGAGTGGGRPVIGAAGTTVSITPPATTPTTTPATGTSGTTGASGVGGTTATSTVDPLAGKPFIDSKTFATMPPYQWARDSVELEAVMGVKGMSKDALLDALAETNNAGRTVYQRLRKPEFANAFTLGYDGSEDIDDLRWDSESHELRERQKFVSLTVEDGRYEPDERTGEREVSLGTDKMDDTYYDTANNDLLKNGISVRGRARWDTDTQIRRLLVGVKANSVVDDLGIKSNDKTDIRNDGASAEEIKSLDEDVRRGVVRWNGRDEPIKPMKGIYDDLRAKGLLPDVGPHEDVLLLEPKVHIRSVRSRYHMNETELSAVRKLYTDGGAPKIQNVKDMIAKARAEQSLTPDEKARLDRLEAQANELLALAKLPDRGWGGAPASFDELEKDRQLAEATDAKFHAFAEELDGARRILTNAREDTFERTARGFVAWQRSVDRDLTNKGGLDPFLAKLDRMSEADLRAFNVHGEQRKAAGDRDFRDFQPITAANRADLRAALHCEVVRVHQRMIEGAGTAARQLYFDEAREFYVPGSNRATSNFIIDTFDLSEYVKHEDWEKIPEAQRTPATPLPRDKVFHATLVAESQIELGMEKAYLDRLKELKGQIDGDRASLAMKWMTAGGRPGVDPSSAATYGVALAALHQMNDAQLGAEVAKLNDFMRQQGSALRPLTVADLRALDAAKLTLEARDKPVRTDGALERNFEGAKWVFDQYVGAQKFLSEVKGDRVLRMLRDNGAPRNITWETTDAAKGELALGMLAGVR
jgi:peptidoglycan hydrolase-like protein with peptidoglycan-binding domain